jgi:prepilin-type N-terminal cleavage/methylation domain-containing protein
MSPQSKVQSPKSAIGGAATEHAPHTTRHASPNSYQSRLTNYDSRITNQRSPGFTLIEIMIVVAIMGIVMTMSVPIVYKVWRKAPLRKAVADVVEVCSNARARAIMQGTMTQVVFHPKENRLEVSGAGGGSRFGGDAGGALGGGAPVATSSGLSARLPDEVIIQELDINMSGIEFRDVETATVRFYPNGISDEMRMVLFDGRDQIGIELEITTGLVNVVSDIREWTRR